MIDEKADRLTLFALGTHFCECFKLPTLYIFHLSSAFPYLGMSSDDAGSDSQSMSAVIGTGISLGVVHVLTGECPSSFPCMYGSGTVPPLYR